MKTKYKIEQLSRNKQFLIDRMILDGKDEAFARYKTLRTEEPSCTFILSKIEPVESVISESDSQFLFAV